MIYAWSLNSSNAVRRCVYNNCLIRTHLLTQQLNKQGYVTHRLKSHRFKNNYVTITIWLIFKKISIFQITEGSTVRNNDSLPKYTPGVWFGSCCSSFYFSVLCCVLVLFIVFVYYFSCVYNVYLMRGIWWPCHLDG